MVTQFVDPTERATGVPTSPVPVTGIAAFNEVPSPRALFAFEPQQYPKFEVSTIQVVCLPELILATAVIAGTATGVD